MTDPVAHGQCIACHEDFHQAQFANPECSQCHTVQGFSSTTFDIDRHDTTAFAINGAHLATPCIDCHRQGEEWQFADVGGACAECHEDIHQKVLDPIFYQPSGCVSCHSTLAWPDISFEHSGTNFALEGAHVDLQCGKCHRDNNGDTSSSVLFEGIATHCSGCHDDPHAGQFSSNRESSCASCHSSVGWSDLKFHHDSTSFSLEGAHAQVECAGCHLRQESASGESFTRYRPMPLTCAECHR